MTEFIFRNGNLLLDMAPGPDGLLPDDAVAAYKQFGDWIRKCYGSPVGQEHGTGYHILWRTEKPVVIDRVAIQENQRFGQRVRKYEVHVNGIKVNSDNSITDAILHRLHKDSLLGIRQLSSFQKLRHMK